MKKPILKRKNDGDLPTISKLQKTAPSSLSSKYLTLNTDFKVKYWTEQCEKDIKERTSLFNSYRDSHSIDVDYFEKSVQSFIEKNFSLAEKRQVLEYKNSKPLPKAPMKLNEFKFSKFETSYIMGSISLKLGEHGSVF